MSGARAASEVRGKDDINMRQSKRHNYQRELDAVLKDIAERIQPDGKVPKLLLHSCCAPCSSYVLEYLSEFFEITDVYYNPNIEPEAEYDHRADELERLIAEMPFTHPVSFVKASYDPAAFHKTVHGLEHIPEGGERCFACYALRLENAARRAAEGGYDFFTTTLSISPLKNAEKINEIGQQLAEKYGVRHLPSDFKKKGGYARSIELSAEYDLYRQDYCGCIYSKREREIHEKKTEKYKKG